MSCKVIMVTSFKGGVGKSTVAANLALCFAYMGKKTLLVDCDFQMRSLDILLGMETKIVYDSGDVLSGKATLSDAVLKDDRNGNMYLLPAPFNWNGEIDIKKFSDMIDDAKETIMPDYIILDTPGSFGKEFSAAAQCSDIAYIVANNSFLSIRAAECTGRELEELGIEERKLIINMFDMSGKSRNDRLSVVEIIDKSYLGLIGIVPYDLTMSVLQDDGKLVDAIRDRNVSKAFANICKRTEGKNIPLFTGFKGINKSKLLS